MAYQLPKLPAVIRRQVEDYIDFLMQKYRLHQTGAATTNPRLSAYGLYQGKIKLSPDFDEPLEAFNDYQ